MKRVSESQINFEEEIHNYFFLIPEAPPPSYDDLDKSKAKEAEANSGGVGWQVQ